MSRQQIEDLHGQASEHYLKGEFREALRAWRDVLALDPGDEQALEGVRLSGLLLDGDETSAAVDAALGEQPAQVETGGGDLGSETLLLDPELLASIVHAPAGGPRKAALDAGAPSLDEDRQGEGLDFGSLEELAAIPLGIGGEESPGPHAPTVDRSSAPSAASQAAAESELHRRVDDLLEEARSLHSQARHAEALGVLSRVAILDEENDAAGELEAEIRDAMGTMASKVDGWIAEGVQAFDQGRMDESREFFERVIEVSPDHREALHYLEKIGSSPDVPLRSVSSPSLSDELLPGMPASPEAGRASASSSSKGPSAELSEPTVPLARPSRAPAARASAPSAAQAGPSLPVSPAATRSRSGSRRPLLAAVGGVLVIGAASAWWFLGRSSQPADPTPTPPPTAGRSAPGVTARGKAGGARPGPVNTAVPVAATFPEIMEKAKSALAAQDYATAVISYNEALRSNPESVDAKNGLALATEGYKARKAELDQVESIKMAFADEEFTSALRLLYRLPKTMDKSRVDRYKVNGWYNLGIIALRAGECSQAKAHFDEALGLESSDEEARRLRSFAERYRETAKDRAFYDQVEGLSFRSLEHGRVTSGQ
jgi:tetratricopeptide (TPR) repeat protein